MSLKTILESETQHAFQLALKKAKEMKQSILFSVTKKIPPAAPLDLYFSGKKLFQGERFYWKSLDDQMMITGLGIAKSFETDKEDARFQCIEEKWNDFLDQGVMINPFSIQGTGPLLFGGFTFDPLNAKRDEWSNFPNGLFYLPTLMQTIYKGITYLTINIVCMPDDNLGRIEQVESIERQLMNDEQKLVSNLLEAVLINQQEIQPLEWKKAVKSVIKVLNESDMEKVVLARKMKLTFDKRVESDVILNRLWHEQHHSFIFCMEAMDHCFIGATPERLINKKGEIVFSTCLAGSTARSGDPTIDEELGQKLLNDEKNRYEHQLVVSMIRKVLEKYCEKLDIPAHPVLMKIRDIQHLYTPVSGKLLKEYSILQLIADLHPTPALGGVPKLEAMKLIRESEAMDRGFYAAPIGWMDYRGNGEFAVALRSGLMMGKEAYIYAGCGVMADSDPDEEYEETKIKFRPMIRSLGGQDI